MIRLLVSDIDGTLVTRDKQLTPATHEAARRLSAAGVALALTSSRPPHGVDVFANALRLTTPRAAFNGAVITDPAGRILSSRLLTRDVARIVLDHLAGIGIPPWLFTPTEWLLLNPAGDYVDWEAKTVQMPYRQVADFSDCLDQAGKIMAASRDVGKLTQCEADLQRKLGANASVHLSQAYYLDITHKEGTKGHAVRNIAALLGIPLAEVAVVGDMANDGPMFEVAPVSIAMGQSPDAVKRAARHVTTSNEDEGWARAVTDFILPDAKGS